MSDLKELFDFIDHERDDVCKMATQGLAQHSKDNNSLTELLRTEKENAAKLVSLVSPKKLTTLGDVLTTLINVSGDATVVEVLTESSLLEKLMRLLDGLQHVDNAPAAAIAALQEMTLMLLNNMTATHLCAVEDLLQIHDEDLKGFHLSRLKLFLDKMSESENSRTCAKWYLQICVNLTRTTHGQLLLAQDDEWLPALVEFLESPQPELRLLSSKTLRNISTEKESHQELITASLVKVCMQRVCEKLETEEEILTQLVETLGFILSSEDGMQAMEGLNAKQLITAALPDLSEKIREFIDAQVLPFLEDVTDAYIVQGTTQDDLD